MFQTTEELVRGTSSILVANMYWMVAFKTHVFDASFSEETPNEAILRFGSYFYHEYFLQYFEGCLGVSYFHLIPLCELKSHVRILLLQENRT